MAGDVLWVQANSGDESLVAGTSARQDRQLIHFTYPEGVLEGLSASEHADEWKVTIAAGTCVIEGDDQADQGKYLVTFPVAEDVSLNPPPGADKRIDVIYAQVRDPNAGGSAGYDAVLSFVEGATHATTPVEPSVPASAIRLHTVLRESTDATWADASITDARRMIAVAQLDVSTAPADGDGLVYDSASGLWVPGNGGTSIPTVKTTKTTGPVTINSTAAFTADVDTALDLVIAAVAGDVIGLSVSGLWSNEATSGCLNMVTRVAAADVNFISTATLGVQAWYGLSGSEANIGGEFLYTVQAGDISGGNVTFRLRARTTTATNKDIRTDRSMQCAARNYGQ